MGVGGLHHAPAALPPGKSRYPLYRRLVGSQGRSGRVRKISLPPAFDPRTILPLASHYTDWAIRAPRNKLLPEINFREETVLSYFIKTGEEEWMIWTDWFIKVFNITRNTLCAFWLMELRQWRVTTTTQEMHIRIYAKLRIVRIIIDCCEKIYHIFWVCVCTLS